MKAMEANAECGEENERYVVPGCQGGGVYRAEKRKI